MSTESLRGLWGAMPWNHTGAPRPRPRSAVVAVAGRGDDNMPTKVVAAGRFVVPRTPIVLDGHTIGTVDRDGNVRWGELKGGSAPLMNAAEHAQAIGRACALVDSGRARAQLDRDGKVMFIRLGGMNR